MSMVYKGVSYIDCTRDYEGTTNLWWAMVPMVYKGKFIMLIALGDYVDHSEMWCPWNTRVSLLC